MNEAPKYTKKNLFALLNRSDLWKKYIDSPLRTMWYRSDRADRNSASATRAALVDFFYSSSPNLQIMIFHNGRMFCRNLYPHSCKRNLGQY